MEDDKAEFGVLVDIDKSDSEILDMIRTPYQESEKYWNKTFGLTKVFRDNVKYWKPDFWKDKDTYDYQEDYLYQDNRIFTSIETVCSVVNSRIPQPEVMPAQSTTMSIQVAKDLQKTLYSYVKKYRIMDLFKLSVRSLLIKRIGYLKLRFDESSGKNGDIITEFISPEDIVVDENARYGDVPRFISQKIKDKTIAEIIEMYPDSEAEILKMIGSSRQTKDGQPVLYKSQLAKKKTIIESWVTYKEDGQVKGALIVHDDNFQHVILKMRNPNFNYDDEKGSTGNILDYPEPPFIPINHLNLGDSYIDHTSLIEQAKNLQDTLNRRGFQIMENAEQAGSGFIFNTDMISKTDMGKLTGSPDERVGVNGDVRAAVTRLTPPLLPNYVIEDKMDARNEIDNIFATHDISRGQKSNNKTLGQDLLQQQQDYTRMDEIARSAERQAALYYRYLTQMMKVYYTEEHWFKVTGEDGQFDLVAMKNDFIEDGIDISVEAGSMLPINKATQEKWVETLMGGKLLDPLTIYEVASGGDLPGPKKMLERFMNYVTDPMGFLGQIKEDEVSREAFMDIQIMKRKKAPEPRDEYSPSYFNFINQYMTTGEFDSQPELVKQLFAAHLTYAKGIANRQLRMYMSRMPTEEEMKAANAKALEQANTDAEMARASGGMGQGQPNSMTPPENQNQMPQPDPSKPNPQASAMMPA